MRITESVLTETLKELQKALNRPQDQFYKGRSVVGYICLESNSQGYKLEEITKSTGATKVIISCLTSREMYYWMLGCIQHSDLKK